MNKTLPVEWEAIHELVNGINDHLTLASQGYKELNEVVNAHSIGLRREVWSKECTKGKVGMGYTCGLWVLFHIMTVGLVERDSVAESANKMNSITPASTAQALRNYIEYFFACEVCRNHFLESFDSCFLDICNRLSSDPKELALWLWEFHNSVNVRLLEEGGEQNNRVITQNEKWAKRWPSKDLCPKCWGEKPWPEWNKTEVYTFLKTTYWVSPELQPFLSRPPEPVSSTKSYTIVAIIGTLVNFCLIRTWQIRKRRKVKKATD